MKNKLLAVTAVMSAALCTSGLASAGGGDWGVHNYPAPEVGVDLVSGAFIDDWQFIMPAGFNLISGVDVSNNNKDPLTGKDTLKIVDGMFAIYSNPDGILHNADDTLVGGWWAYDGTTGSLPHVVAIAPGKYYYEVTGTGVGIGGLGLYTLSSSISPVPEPETYGLMLAGLGILGMLARRRRPA